MKRGHPGRIKHWAFDTETVDGEPILIQFAGRFRGEVKGWAVPVDKGTILDALMGFLQTNGDAGHTNILWSHVSEYDVGVSFIQFPEIWEGPRWDWEFIADEDTVAQVHLRHFDNPYHDISLGHTHWRLLDTFSWFKQSLEKTCEQLQLPARKMKRPEWLGQRQAKTAEEIAYLEAYAINDAISTLHLGEFIASMHEELDIPMSISIAHMASHVFRKRFLGEDPAAPVGRVRLPHVHRLATHEAIPVLPATGEPKFARIPAEIPEQRIPFPFLAGNKSPELYHASIYSYHGGKNGLYVPPGIYEGVREVDIISAYPTAMKALPPMTEGEWEPTEEFVIAEPFATPPVPRYAGIYRVTGSVQGRCPYGVFMDHEGSVKFKEGQRFENVWVTGWELACAWGELALEDLFGYIWRPAPGAINPFDHYVDFFFEKKNTTPKADPRYQMYKLLLNALYGKLIQRADEEGKDGRVTTAGMLFNPFWASQITGHCRARLHQLEHTYSAIHSSTDSILTQSTAIPTGHGLGDLEVKAEGTLTVLRNKLYILKAGTQIEKFALHGFRGRVDDLARLIEKGGAPYKVMHMWRPRESARQGQKPFRMTEREFHLDLPQEVWDAVNPHKRKDQDHGWSKVEARRA